MGQTVHHVDGRLFIRLWFSPLSLLLPTIHPIALLEVDSIVLDAASLSCEIYMIHGGFSLRYGLCSQSPKGPIRSESGCSKRRVVGRVVRERHHCHIREYPWGFVPCRKADFRVSMCRQDFV